MKKSLSIILCAMLLLCLFSCEAHSRAEKPFGAKTEAPTEKKQWNGDYNDLYDDISVGDTYEYVAEYMGSEGVDFQGNIKEWDLGDGKYLHVTLEADDEKGTTVSSREIFYVKKNEAVSSTVEMIAPSSEKYAQIREIADAALLEELPALELDRFNVTISLSNMYLVTYTVLLGGHPTEDTHKVFVDTDLSVTKVTLESSVKYYRYTSLVTEDEVNQAKAKMYERIQKYTETESYYFSIPDDNVLYLRCEIIFEVLYPEKAELDLFEYDHKHVFFSEPVCKLP